MQFFFFFLNIPRFFLTEWSNTWNTVSKLCQKLSKLWRVFSSLSLKLNFPPKTYSKNKRWRNKSTVCICVFASLRLRVKSTCMPRRAKMTMKRKSRSSSEAIDCIEFSREATKFDSDLQYLQREKNNASYISRMSKLRVFRDYSCITSWC